MNMKPVLLKTRRDSIDIDHLGQLCAHSGYQLLQERIRQTLETSARDLKAAKTWEESLRLQGRITALELAVDLPGVLIAEIRASLKREGRAD